MLFGLGKKKLIGLDIGSSTIKAAEMVLSSKGAVLNSFAMLPTPPQATSGGDIVDPGLLSDAVKQLLSELNTKRKYVATGLWGASVIVKRISIPRMDEALIAEQIRWEAEQYIPYDINEVNLDYKILDVGASDTETMDVLLIAAIQEMIFNCTELINQAGYACSILDVEGFALANCFELNYGVRHGETIGLLNVGASVTNFVVVDDGEVIFCRDIPIGGLAYTNELSKSLGISMTEAEGVKLAIAVGQPVPEEAGAILEASHDMLIEEISGSIEFFHNTTAGATLGKLFITGGGARTLGFFQSLGQRIACEQFDPFLSVTTNPKVFSSDYIDQVSSYAAISIGLGVRELGDT